MSASTSVPYALLNQRYELLGIIGSGQYGTAWKAISRTDGQTVCLKRIPLNSKDDHKGALQEAQLLSSLDHPNIISYIESFLDSEGALCIATTYCEDGDLFSKIRSRKAEGNYFTEAEVMDTFIQVASALMYIHSHKILHRDLKTQNIFLRSNGIVMLGDFGICKVLEKTDAFATTVTGTPYYMAPEVCTNQPYTLKSDIWSLGCVLYELCTLTHAFAADSLLSLVYQIVRGSYPPVPAELFSQGMIDLVQHLLTQEASQRPSLQQVLSSPYVQSHMQRFNADENLRILRKQTSLSMRPGLTVPAVCQYDDPNEATVPGGLTPKQRIAWRKEEERRRRQLELQVASVNVSKDRQEVAKRKKSQLASSSLAGILPAPAQKQHSPQDVLIACGRPGSPQQQTDIAGALSPSRPAAPGHVRPASAAAVYGTRLGTMAGSPERVWPLTTHNSDAACGSGGKSSGNTHTTKSPSSLSPDRARATQQVLVEKARPASLTTAGPAALGVAGSGSSNGWKTAYQAYEDRPVGGGSTNKAGLLFYSEDDDTVNIGTMPPQQQDLGDAGKRNSDSRLELSMDSDSVLLGSVVQQQRPFTAPTGPGLVRQPGSMHGLQQPLPSQQPQQGAKAQPALKAQADKLHPKLPIFPKATLAVMTGIQRATSEPGVALSAAAAAAAAASPSGFKFGLDTVERRVLSCNGGNAAPEPAASSSSIQHSMLAIDRGGMIRFGARCDSDPPSAFDFVLAGADLSDDGGTGANSARQQSGLQQSGNQCTQQVPNKHQQQRQHTMESSMEHQDRHSSKDSSGASKPAVQGSVVTVSAAAQEVESASDASEDYEYDFEEYEVGEADEVTSKSLQAEVEQRKRIMQTIADLSKSFSTVSMSSGCSSTGSGANRIHLQQTSSSDLNTFCRSNGVQQQQQPKQQVPLSLAPCQALLGAQYQPVYDYLLEVHRSAAAGGVGVSGEKVKEHIVSIVGRDKAKQEACFRLEQVLFRAVLAEQ